MRRRATTLANAEGYKVLLILSMFYMSIMICNAVLTNRYIGNNTLFVLGGSFTSPLLFVMDDIIAEIYGYSFSRSIILVGFIAQSFFVLVCQFVLHSPSPRFFNHQEAYE